jgi:hypothetical protein
MIERLKTVYSDMCREDYYQNLREENEDILLTVDREEDQNALRIYVLVRSDILPPLHQGIQAAHAIVELYLRAQEDAILRVNDWSNLWKWARYDKTLILLASEDIEFDVEDIEYRYPGLPVATFAEPDLGNIVTAAAFKPVIKAMGDEMFIGFELAR